jgi:CHAT domain-containing protein
LISLTLICGLSCTRHGSPQIAFERIHADFEHGRLEQSQNEAHREGARFRNTSPDWAWQFGVLEAEAALWRGNYSNVLELLESGPKQPDQPNLLIPILTLEAIAHARLHQFAEAALRVDEADRLCGSVPDASCGKLIQAHGLIAKEQGNFAAARQFFERALAFARSNSDQFLESTSLLNLGAVSLNEERFDEAIDLSEASYKVSTAIDAGNVAMVAQGNMGWAYYKLGDAEKALQKFQETDKAAAEKGVGDVFDRENELTNIGYVFMDASKFDLAAQSFQQALSLAEGINSKEDAYNALRVLARLALLSGDTKQADVFAARALGIARESHNHVDELYPMLVQGQVAALRGNIAEAEARYRDIEQDQSCPVFLKWEAEHSLAQLYESENRADSADNEYQTALATFEAARKAVHHEASQLSFLTNASRIYDDYLHFLITRGKPDDALRWADFSRARSLAEGLGLLGKESSVAPAPLNARQIARHANATLLFYWLGEKESYLWAITPQKISLFPLPPESEMDSAVQRYQRALANLQDALATQNPDGIALYQTLVAPAQALISKDTKVLIVPDGSLNKVNFETLLVQEPRPHYWIEDATVSNAASLRMLSAARLRPKVANTLLLVGDALPPDPEFGRLPNAKLEMANIEKYFASPDRAIYAQTAATPKAYFDSGPQRFSYIHFVAHGTASSLSPLDSAVILSQDSQGNKSFKLYARDIIQRPLQANLVTISTCFGAGSRAYTGEGLVGLSWAFLRAGAHNVIGALWEADDTATPELMDHFYGELKNRQNPDIALRSAKLSLLHSTGVFRKPFYWAPFQLYTGS